MKPVTEETNPKTRDIDRRSTLEIIRLINEEDRDVAEAVSRVLDRVAEAVDLIVERLKSGGHLIYVGTGTSGRLGVLDASECPPTFGVPPNLVRGVIAGGYAALHRAVEAAEDNPDAAIGDLEAINLSPRDCVVGISASGDTPYTLGALEYARELGAATVAVTCNPDSRMAGRAEITIAPVVGPEVIAGSSRMKAGTAQKMILNTLSTATMIKLGRVHGNLMTYMRATNQKLRRRAGSIIALEAQVTEEAAREIFDASGQNLRIALLMAKHSISREFAQELVDASDDPTDRSLDESIE